MWGNRVAIPRRVHTLASNLSVEQIAAARNVNLRVLGNHSERRLDDVTPKPVLGQRALRESGIWVVQGQLQATTEVFRSCDCEHYSIFMSGLRIRRG
jgi:hypothetical protein